MRTPRKPARDGPQLVHGIGVKEVVGDADAHEAVRGTSQAARDVPALGPERDEHGAVDAVRVHRLEEELDRRGTLGLRQGVDAALGIQSLRQKDVHVTIDPHRGQSRRTKIATAATMTPPSTTLW